MLKLEIQICQMKIEKEKKNIWKNYYYKRKKLLIHSINRVEKLENVSLLLVFWVLKGISKK